MLNIKMKPLKNLAKKVKLIDEVDYYDQQNSCKQSLLITHDEENPCTTNIILPMGFFAIYVGDDQENERFVVPIRYLSHPLFKILLEKAYDDAFGRLVVPCSVSTFQEVVNAVESNHGRFDMRKLFEEFV